MTPRISVVVPVYNPGPRFEPCIASLRSQTLPRSAYEVILVDDGSTDGTGQRLDELAAGDPHLTVIHQPNSGWPGRPRNVGTDAATGDYVLYVDNDDWLGREALERLTAHVANEQVDVVMFKEVGENRPLVRTAWRRTVIDAKLGRDPVMKHLTPHKMFRRAFLQEHGIRFPEGSRRLEDHHFVMRAFFAAKRVDILADYGYYHWILHPARSNASLTVNVDPHLYYTNLREVLDIVEEHTEPGPYRDKLYGHWYSTKVLKSATRLHKLPADAHQDWLDEIRTLVDERFGEHFDEPQPCANRVRSSLVRQGRLTDLVRLGLTMERLRLHAHVDRVSWVDGALEVDVTAALTLDGTPLAFRAGTDSLEWAPPLPLEDVDRRALRVGSRRVRVAATLARRERADYYFVPVKVRRYATPAADGTVQAAVSARLRIDPARAALGEPLGEGAWQLELGASIAGWGANTALGPNHEPRLRRRSVLRPRTLVSGVEARAFWNAEDHLGLAVGARA